MEERAEVLAAIIKKVEAMMNESGLTEDTAYADLPMKSVNFSALINVLEDEFDVEINYMEFKKTATLGESADFVMEVIEG